MRTSFARLTAVSCGLLLSTASVQAAQPHQHGVAKLDVAVEAKRITLQFESPLDNLLGYERAPRTDAERKQADAMLTRLKSAEAMFKIDPAAQCTAGPVTLASAALALGTPDPAEAVEGHADIDGGFEFNCVDATKATHIEVGLFTFARLQRLEVQVVTPRGQAKRDLKRPATRIPLGK